MPDHLVVLHLSIHIKERRYTMANKIGILVHLEDGTTLRGDFSGSAEGHRFHEIDKREVLEISSLTKRPSTAKEKKEYGSWINYVEFVVSATYIIPAKNVESIEDLYVEKHIKQAEHAADSMGIFVYLIDGTVLRADHNKIDRGYKFSKEGVLNEDVVEVSRTTWKTTAVRKEREQHIWESNYTVYESYVIPIDSLLYIEDRYRYTHTHVPNKSL